MTITTTSLGSYSTQITLSNETNSTAMITALDAAIIAGGWSQYDVFNNGTQRIYRSLNKDAVTYKYISFFIDIATWKISTSSFESWNATTHVGTNEVASFSRQGAGGYSLYGSDIVLMVSNRWCIIQTFVRGQVSQWSGVIEVQREAAEDTAAAGYPCFVWVCSSNILSSAASAYQMASFPRSRANGTGASAVATSLQTPYTRLGANGTSDTLNNYIVYPYDTSKRIAQSLRPAIGLSEVHGRMFGLKATYNIAAPYSRINVNVDSDFNYSGTGTATEHWVLGETVHKNPISMFTPGINQTFATVVSTTTGLAASTGRCAIYTGQYYYTGTSIGLSKIDAGPSLAVLVSPVNGLAVDIYDVTYDGRYVYATTPTGVLRVDPTTDVATSLTLTNGGGSIYFDGTFIWVAARGSRANNVVYKVDATSFSLLATITVASTVNAIGGMTTDFNGNLYIMTASGDSNIYKLVISTGAVTVLVNVPLNYATITNIMYDGAYLHVIGCGGANMNYIAYTLAGVAVANLQTGVSVNSTATTYKAPLNKIGPYILGGGNAASVTSLVTFSPFGILPASSTLTGPSGTMGHVIDGNKMYCMTGGGQLSVYNFINHPDESGVAHGRLLLPK